MSDVSTSKFISLILRHKPDTVGITLDGAGWVEVEVLLAALRKHGHPLDRKGLDHIVATNDKKRFYYNEDGIKIRACQGHSLKSVDLQLEAKEPPEYLFHGTASRFLSSIMEHGLIPGNRQYVHLSMDEGTARKVGARHGEPSILRVAALKMYQDKYVFYLSHNNVWLTKGVPVEYLETISPMQKDENVLRLRDLNNALKNKSNTTKPLDVRGIPPDSVQGKIDIS